MNNTQTPSFSVIVPCYNQAQYLAECLTSVRDQTIHNWECIIIDDGSPDNTKDIASSFCEKDNRFIYLRKDNGGLSSARNWGIRHAKGIFILPLDADDKISPNYLELASDAFEKNTNLSLVYSYYQLFGERNGIVKDNRYDYTTFLYENQIFCSCIYRKSDFGATGGYDETMKNGYEDWDFLLQLLNPNSIVYQIPEVCFFYRIKRESMITNIQQNIDILTNTLNYIFKKNIEKYTYETNPLYVFSHTLNLEGTRKQLDFEKQRVKKLSNSIAFKIGSILMNPILKIRNVFHKFF